MHAAGNAATRTAASHIHRYGDSVDICKTSRKSRKSGFDKTYQTQTDQAMRNLLVLRAPTV